MSKRKQVRRLVACTCAATAGLVLAAGLYSKASAGSRPKASATFVRVQERVDIRLRSLTTRATGQLTIEASEGGGRARLTALNLPDPQTIAAGSTTYVVWAVSGGRIVNLGELRRDERGNGGLAFERPEGLERYGVIVTAETSPAVERPGDPVLTTRADEAATLYPAKTESAPDTATNTARSNNAKAAPAPLPPAAATPRARDTSGDFYAEVEDALASRGGGRVIELEGDSAAPNARGAARATLSSNRAYVRANFRGVPLPSALGASVYVLWGVIPDGRIVYMGSLPATADLNRAEVYVRVAGFETDDYTLLVTAERARPAPAPDGRRLLKPKDAASVK
ncbi:MAG: anti-sigma factor domain-containing protein [Pyrinomonadaceae bacterium]